MWRPEVNVGFLSPALCPVLCHRTSSSATIRLHGLVGTSWALPISGSIALGCGHALLCPALTWMLEMQAQVLMLAQQARYSWAISWAMCVCLSSFPPSTGVFTSPCCPGWHQACDRPVLVSRHAPPHDLWHLWQALVLSENRLPSSRGLIPLVCVQCMNKWGWTRLCLEANCAALPFTFFT